MISKIIIKALGCCMSLLHAQQINWMGGRSFKNLNLQKNKINKIK